MGVGDWRLGRKALNAISYSVGGAGWYGEVWFKMERD
jgi:hypothetical protein